MLSPFVLIMIGCWVLASTTFSRVLNFSLQSGQGVSNRASLVSPLCEMKNQYKEQKDLICVELEIY